MFRIFQSIYFIFNSDKLKQKEIWKFIIMAIYIIKANVKKLDRQFMHNISSHYLLILRGTRRLQIDSYIEINKNLLQALRKNYNVED